MKFYKYQAVNKYSLSALSLRSFYYANPSKFNDPFEFKFDSNILTEEIVPAFKEISESLKKLSNTEVETILEAVIPSHIEEAGIASLSKTKQNIQMWSHYADDHKGMCIEFDASKPPSNLLPVIYSKSLPKITAPQKNRDKSDPILNMLIDGGVINTKHEGWQYEEEVRLVVGQGNILEPYPEEFKLVSIIFGARSTQEDQALVRAVLGNSEVKFTQAKLDNNAFKIAFDDC